MDRVVDVVDFVLDFQRPANAHFVLVQRQQENHRHVDGVEDEECEGFLVAIVPQVLPLFFLSTIDRLLLIVS